MNRSIREKIEKATFDLSDSHSIKITASFGISIAKRAKEAETAINKADANLYLAKHRGRNQICSENDRPRT